jgi:hypothetical protein
MEHADEDGLLAMVFEDLEQQAEGLALAERDAELADRSRAEYAQVTLAARVHASLGRPVLLELLGAGPVRGTLARAGTDWCLVADDCGPGAPEQEWLVRLGALRGAQGLSERAVAPEARPAVARLGFGSALRRLGEGGAELVLCHVDGSRSQAAVVRVGSDFVEVTAADGPAVLTFAGLAAVGRA